MTTEIYFPLNGNDLYDTTIYFPLNGNVVMQKYYNKIFDIDLIIWPKDITRIVSTYENESISWMKLTSLSGLFRNINLGNTALICMHVIM